MIGDKIEVRALSLHKRIWVLVKYAVTLTMMVLAVGCKPAQDKVSVTPASSEPEQKKIALIVKYLGNPFFESVREGAELAAAEFELDLAVYSASGDIGSQQAQIVRRLVEEGIDGIVLMPVESTELVPAVVDAYKKGISLVTIDTPLDASAIEKFAFPPPPLITVDNEQAAFELGVHVINSIQQQANVLILAGSQAAINFRQRYQGFKRATASIPEAHLVHTIATEWNIQKGYEETLKYLAENDSINVILASTDLLALGAAKAAKELKRQVAIGGYDNLVETHQVILNGDIVATIDQNAEAQGYEGVKTLNQLMQGKMVQATTLLKATVVAKEQLDGSNQ